MVCAARKHMTKEAKLELIASRKKSVESRRDRDDKKWKKTLAKMSEEKKAQYRGTGNTKEHGRRRGVTRNSQLKRDGRKPDNYSIEATIHLAKYMKTRTFHKRAPIAVKKLKSIAAKLLKTKDNRVDSTLNNFLWHRGVKGVPGRVRVLITRKVAEAPEGGSQRKRFYSILSYVPVADFKGLTTKITKQ
eukprot:GILI01000557.1.p1 GENE.GILI01000557.1~~GILI01000557.1.p1  ORF type:complete len:189 (-),score=88.26 GILI01000557.1:60-626(-)